MTMAAPGEIRSEAIPAAALPGVILHGLLPGNEPEY